MVEEVQGGVLYSLNESGNFRYLTSERWQKKYNFTPLIQIIIKTIHIIKTAQILVLSCTVQKEHGVRFKTESGAVF